MELSKHLWLVFYILLELHLLVSAGQDVILVAEFNSKRVSGTVQFSQTADNVTISVKNLTWQNGDKLAIHEFPVKFIGPMSEICKPEHVGEIFDPKNARKVPNYDNICRNNQSACAVGDLYKKFKRQFDAKNVEFSDNDLSLMGQESIFGRSLVIQDSSNHTIACASIGSLAAIKSAVAVFRAVSPGISGTIVLRQSSSDFKSDTSLDIKLLLVDARSESKKGLLLAIHKNASRSDSEGSCLGIDDIFNPTHKTSCDRRRPSTCPVGDLTGKLGTIEVPLPDKDSHFFFIDTNLPLSGPNSVAGRSLVISENGKPLICATIQEFQEMEAEITLGGTHGLNGIISFKQGSMYEPASVNVSISGSSVQSVIHEQHLQISTSDSSGCSNSSLGRTVLNITGSGKYGGLTLYGPRSVIFRPVVVADKTDKTKTVCKVVQPKQPTYHLKAQGMFMGSSSDALGGSVFIEQVAFNFSKAFSYFASIIMDVHYKNNRTKKTSGHNWHVHLLPIDDDASSPIGKRCTSAKGHYNPYNVYVVGNEYRSTCSSNFPFRCELGDLSNKLGTYTIGGGVKQFTETENYLASWHNVIGRSIVIHAEGRGDPRIGCADLHPMMHSSYGYSQETLHVRNSSSTRDKAGFQKTVSEALGVATWRVADVNSGGVNGDNGCLNYSFLLIDDSSSNLHQVLADIVNDQRHKLKDFAPGCEDASTKWKISDGNVSEILGVVFGFIALIVLVICFVIWLRRKDTEEQESKLVDKVDRGTVSNPGFSEEREPTVPVETIPIPKNEENDVSEQAAPSKKEWKLTTSL